MDIVSEERMREYSDDDNEFLEAFTEIAEFGVLSDWANKQLNHERIYMIKPEKYKLARILYKQMKIVLEECCASYKISIRKDRFLNNIILEVHTDDFHTTCDTSEVFRFIVNHIDWFECNIGYDLFKNEANTLTKDAIKIRMTIINGFMELSSIDNDMTEDVYDA